MDEQKNDSGFLVFPRKSLILKRRRGLASGGPPLSKRQPARNKIYVQFLKRAFLFSAVKLILCSRSTPGTWCHSFSSLANSLLGSLLRHHVNHKQENWCEQTYFKIGLKIPPLPLADILTWGRFLPLPLPGSIALPWPLTSANLENFKLSLHFHFKINYYFKDLVPKKGVSL